MWAQVKTTTTTTATATTDNTGKGVSAKRTAVTASAEVVHELSKQLDVALVMYVFHVMSEEMVRACLLTLVACLNPGGMVIGMCVGSETPGPWGALTPDGSALRHLHTIDTLKQEFLDAGFSRADVVKARRDIRGGGGESDGEKARGSREMISLIFTAWM